MATVYLAQVVMRVRSIVLSIGLSLASLILLVWVTMRWWPGDWSSPTQLLNYLTPWLLAALVPTLVLALLLRRHGGVGWLFLAIPILLISLPLLPLFLPRLGSVPDNSFALKVMSYSICTKNQDNSAIIQVIRAAQPDVLLLQEITPEMAGALHDGLHDLYPAGEVHFAYAAVVQQLIVSRYPLTSVGVVPEQGDVQKVRLETPGGSIKVWNVHASHPYGWTQHNRELSALAEEISTFNGPLIVGGDFNAVELSESYRLVARDLKNAHQEAGWGFGFTYPAPSLGFGCRPSVMLPISLPWKTIEPIIFDVRDRFYALQEAGWGLSYKCIGSKPDFVCRPVIAIPYSLPLVRIDHIFYSDHFYARQAGTLPTSGGSDHLPVMAELSLKD